LRNNSRPAMPKRLRSASATWSAPRCFAERCTRPISIPPQAPNRAERGPS
jgi:hypothetical protein